MSRWVGALALLLAGACAQPPVQAPPQAPEEAVVRFVDSTTAAGLDRDTISYAAAAADFDGDGWTDLAVSLHGSVALFHNERGSFRDVAAEMGFVDDDTHGLSWLDHNGDGLLDLLVTVGANRGFGNGPNQVYHGDGRGRLRLAESVEEVVRDPNGRGRCACLMDLRGNGRAGVVVMNAPQKDRPNRAALTDPTGTWTEFQTAVTTIQAECLTSVRLSPAAEPVVIAYGGGAHSGHAFRRSDDGGIVDVTEELGLPIAGDTVHSVAAGDVDLDGDLDLYFVSGHHFPPEVTTLDEGLGFRLVASGSGDLPRLRFSAPGDVELDLIEGFTRQPQRIYLGGGLHHPPSSRFTVAAADPDLEGAPAIAADSALGIYLWRPAPGLYEVAVVGDGAQVRGISGIVRGDGPIEVVSLPAQARPRPRPKPNRLFVNDDGHLRDDTERAGVGDPGSGRDAAFFDADNDGDLDLFVVNAGGAFSNHPDVLYLNRGDGRFTDATAELGLAGPERGRGCSLTVLDVDRDGRLDLFVTNGEGPPFANRGPFRLWHNRTTGGNGWAELDLRPARPNGAHEAMVSVDLDERRLLLARTSSNGRFSTSLTPFHLGLGDRRQAEVTVHWPSGKSHRLTLEAGQRRVLDERD